MKLKPVLLGLFLTFPFFSFAQKTLTGADSARMLIDTVLNYAAKNSLYRDKVNWNTLKDSVHKRSAGAANLKEVMPAIQLMYKMLGDFHGTALYKSFPFKWNSNRSKVDNKLYTEVLKKIRSGTVQIETRMLENGYGYIVIPGNNPTKAGEAEAITKQLQDSLTKLNPANLRGIVIDLRLNYGGNMYPMILGVGNLLSKGKLGAFVYPDGKRDETWYIKGNTIYADTQKVLSVPVFCKVNPKIKIAVLTSPYTASSGEATAISFKGQKNALVIGDATAGYTTANESFYYMGVQVLMATSVEADRNGVVYYDNVVPDQEIKAGDDLVDFSKDQKIIAAMKWLKGK